MQVGLEFEAAVQRFKCTRLSPSLELDMVPLLLLNVADDLALGPIEFRRGDKVGDDHPNAGV